MNETEKPAAVKIMFKSSSQPKGQDGFELAVSSDATEADVDRTMLLAAKAREQAQAVLAGEYTGLDDEVDANVPQELKDALSRVTPEDLARILADLRVRDDDAEEAARDDQIDQIDQIDQARRDAEEGAYERTMMRDQRA